jgi:hypothetical protein
MLCKDANAIVTVSVGLCLLLGTMNDDADDGGLAR